MNPTIAHAFAYPDALMRACPDFALPAPDPIENEPVHSEVPVLIFAGEYDPNTPATFGRLAGETLPNSFYFEFRGFGHVVLSQQAARTGPPACAMEVMAAFIDDPLHAPDGSWCGRHPGATLRRQLKAARVGNIRGGAVESGRRGMDTAAGLAASTG